MPDLKIALQFNLGISFNITAITELADCGIKALRLIGDSLSYLQTAQHLMISEKTVKGHVSNILGKLHVADRTQAAVYAWQKGIVRRDS
jgi:NarL family two-component system response regulator LiaR